MLADGWLSVTGARSDANEDGPVVDLSGKKPVIGSWLAAPANGAKAKWMDDFINHLGRSETQRNPNATLRLQVPTSVTVAPKLGVLDHA